MLNFQKEDYMQYSTEKVYLHDADTFIEQPKGRIKYLCTIIHDGVKVISADAVRNRESIKSISIPNSVTSIGDNVFRDCKSLTSVTIPDSVKTIGENAFGGCTSLNYIEIPDSVVHIDSKAFSNCSFQRDNFIYNRRRPSNLSE